MNSLRPVLLISACLFFAGCSKTAEETAASTERSFEAEASLGEAAGFESAEGAAEHASDGTLALTPQNTEIQFVGTHVVEGGGPDPKARTGVFKKFHGQAKVADDDHTLQSVWVEIDTQSLDTGITKLTNHLNSPDFFDTREYPTARFESTSIRPSESGSDDVTITGDLTLHGTTKEISFPAQVSAEGHDLNLTANFVIDRAEFGMDQMTDNVNKEVTMTVTIGKGSEAAEADSGEPAPEDDGEDAGKNAENPA